MNDNKVTCKGENYFFWLPRNNGSKIHFSKFGSRMKSNNSIFCNPVYICLECRSFNGPNHQMKGHTVMIFHDKKWELFLIWKQTPDYMTAFPFDNDQLFDIKKEVTFNLNKKDYFMKYVNIYFPDSSWLKGKSILNKEIKNLCSINPFDGCLDAGTCPTLFEIARFPEKDFLVSPSCSVTPNDNKRKSTNGLRKRKGQKRQKKITVDGELAKEWLTLYIVDHNPMESLTSSKEPIIMVPELGTFANGESPFFEKKFHAVKRENLLELDDLVASCYEVKLKSLSLCEYSMVGFCHEKQPTRISLCSKEEFELLPKVLKNLNKYDDCSEPFYWEFSKKGNSYIPGVVVSMWDTLHSIKDFYLPNHYKRMQDRFGSAYGDRYSVPCGAMNAYFGPNNSSRPSISPIYGPGMRKDVDYDRKNYHHDEYHQELIRKLKHGNHIITTHARKVDTDYMKFINSSVKKSNKKESYRMIWTQGTSRRVVTKINRSGKLSTSTSKVRRKYNGIGFYNKPHYDPNDKIPAKYTLHWIEDQKLHKNFKEKVSGMHHNLGIGFPTTIGYNFCAPEKVDIFAYFICWGFATSITEKSFHHFYGWCFPHCTTLPIYAKKRLIILTNDGMSRDDSVYVGAWGFNNRFKK